MKKGSLVDFTPDLVISGHPQVNKMIRNNDQIILSHMVGQHIEEANFPMTKQGLKDAMKLLNL